MTGATAARATQVSAAASRAARSAAAATLHAGNTTIRRLAARSHRPAPHTAIEASRGGDAGSGIGVVAEKMRRLAPETWAAAQGMAARREAAATRLVRAELGAEIPAGAT
ncbi:MAG: hypothetical protein ACFBRM_08490 [Pikeienuella sp.]